MHASVYIPPNNWHHVCTDTSPKTLHQCTQKFCTLQVWEGGGCWETSVLLHANGNSVPVNCVALKLARFIWRWHWSPSFKGTTLLEHRERKMYYTQTATVSTWHSYLMSLWIFQPQKLLCTCIWQLDNIKQYRIILLFSVNQIYCYTGAIDMEQTCQWYIFM